LSSRFAFLFVTARARFVPRHHPTATPTRKQRGDNAHQAKYVCVIDIALERLISWQVGSPLPNRYTAQASPSDTKALGGVQNEAFNAGLRIDVTQHPMHALQLARQYVY
jgi:hypothetical protein